MQNLLREKPHGNFCALKHTPVCVRVQLLEEKLRSRYRTVREAFCTFDSDNDGIITDKEMRRARK